MKKGQYFSFDAIIASIIFILAFTSLITYWYQTKEIQDSKNLELMETLHIFSNDIFSVGHPENWDEDESFPNQLGIMDKNNPFMISWNKFSNFSEFFDEDDETYQNMIRIYGLENYKLGFNMIIYNNTGDFNEIDTIQKPTSLQENMTFFQRTTRIAGITNYNNTQENKIARLELIIYQN